MDATESTTSQESETEESLNDFDLEPNHVDSVSTDLVIREVRNFTALNGFVNVHLLNDQFMDRVSVSISKRKVTNKDKTLLEKQNSLGAPEIDDRQQTYNIKPIGFLESCFREKFGTPRQSGFVKNARARLTLVNEINSSCLEGIDGFSYIWIIFIFHIGLKDYNNKKSKIKPPKLDGAKKGVFATRSPHRYNPIGLSIAKLDKLDGRTIHISGIDLIHGTPVIDIKPYHYLDSLPADQLQFPGWLLESRERGRFQTINFCESAKSELQAIIADGN